MVVNELVDSIFPEKPTCNHGKTNNKNQQITIKTRVILFLNNPVTWNIDSMNVVQAPCILAHQ